MRSPLFAGVTAGWVLENIADSLLLVILGVWVADLTGDPGLAALVFAVAGVPALISPLFGRLADRVSRRRMLAALCLLGAASLVPLLFLPGPEQFWWIYVTTLVYGVTVFGSSGCRGGILRDLLEDDELGAANALFQTIDQVGGLALPFLAAGVYMWTGPAPLIAAAAACFVAAAAVFLLLRFAESPVEDEQGGFWRSVTAGFRHLARTPPLARMTAAIVLMVCASGLTSAVGFAVLDRIGVEAAWMGPLEAMTGVGGILAGLVAAVAMRRLGRGRLPATGAVVAGIGQGPMLGDSVWLLGGGLALIGVGWTSAIVSYSTEVQIRTPSRLLGRATTSADLLMQLPRVVLTAGGASALGLVDAPVVTVAGIALTAMAVIVAAQGRAGRDAPAGE